MSSITESSYGRTTLTPALPSPTGSPSYEPRLSGVQIKHMPKRQKRAKMEKKEEVAGVEGKLIEGNQAEPFVFAQFATDYASCKFTTVCLA